mgnify:FL=1
MITKLSHKNETINIQHYQSLHKKIVILLLLQIRKYTFLNGPNNLLRI